MKYSLIISLFILNIFLTPPECHSQENSKKQTIISFFLDCEDCDPNFIQQEIPFLSFVRDPQLADVHILTTNSDTGSGGKKYFLSFIGMKEFKGTNFEYELFTKQSDTNDDIRKALLKIIKIGIMPYYSKTSFLDQLNVDISEIENRKADEFLIDPWKKWVFELESGGEFHKEESQNEYSLIAKAQAKKVTEKWKLKIKATYEIIRENYFDNGEKITNKQDSKELKIDYIKSLSDKLSAGLFGNYSSTTFLNIDNSYIFDAGIEYNFFPWKDCNRRVFSIGYRVGVNALDYNKETIYDKMKETLAIETIALRLELIQPWGEIATKLEGRHFFQDFSKNRLTLESDLSIRLTKQLSVSCAILANVIHDQVYLQKGEASVEDLLLKRWKLASTYEIKGQLGFRYTFGSFYNNVVNERF